jgi:hypothetical protein
MLGISLGAVVMTLLDPTIFGIPIDLILFGLSLLCIAVFHHHTLRLALVGLVAIVFVIAFMIPVETLTVPPLFSLSAPRVIDAQWANPQ